MKSKFLLFIGLLLLGTGLCSAENELKVSKKSLNDYKIYALARCITDNYTNMGVDFNQLRLKDSTMGFIDIEEGYALGSTANNALDEFIKSKTGDFYKPKQTEGDLAIVNMVIYDCAAFSQSKVLEVFLSDLIVKANLKIEK